MGGLFIGQQYMQNVLGYSTLEAGLAILPMAAFMVLVAPGSAKLVNQRGSRLTLIAGFAFLLLGFLAMLLLWKQHIPYWKVGLAYALIGIGVGLAGTPASHSLTASVSVRRAGMASGTADLQRDLGGAIMQSIFGALLAAGYAKAFSAAIAAAPDKQQHARHLTTGQRQAPRMSWPCGPGQLTLAAGRPGKTAPELLACAALDGASRRSAPPVFRNQIAAWPAAIRPPAELITGVDRVALLQRRSSAGMATAFVISPAFRR